MRLTYIWHDCFLLELSNAVLLFDYWLDKGGNILKQIPIDKPIYIFVSHHHKDHFNKRIFALLEAYNNVKYIISRDTAKMIRYLLTPNSVYKGGNKLKPDNVVVLEEGEQYCDELIKVYAFGSTDIGNSYLIENVGKYIFHAGDLNVWVCEDALSSEEINQAVSDFNSKLQPIREITDQIDLAMFPVDSRLGGKYWLGANIFVREFEVYHFVPMHFCPVNDIDDSMCRMEDAISFDRYSNKIRGEYHALTTPYQSIDI